MNNKENSSNRKIKVLMMPTWYSDRNAKTMMEGVFHYEQSIALKKYVDVALYFPYDKHEKKSFIKSYEHGLLTYRSSIKRNYIFSIIKGIYKVLKDYKPDIIHAHVATEAGFIAALFGRIFNIPVVITEHSPVELTNLKIMRNRIKAGFAYRNSLMNVCVSKDLLSKLRKIFFDNKFTLIYNGVVDPIKVISNNTLKKYYKDGNINIAVVAVFYSKTIKGFQYLLPAIKKLKDKGISIVLHICGGGEYLTFYKSLAQKLGIKDNCIFYDQCNKTKVYEIIEEMDFVVSSSLVESAGVSIQEALLLGKPVVVTESGGTNSLCSDSNAIIVERKSVTALVNGIEQMINELHNDSSKYDKNQIRDYALERFEMDKVCKKYYVLYKKILMSKKV